MAKAPSGPEPAANADTFDNAADHYELVHVASGRAIYRFTNHAGKTLEADMPLASWQRIARGNRGTVDNQSTIGSFSKKASASSSTPVTPKR